MNSPNRMVLALLALLVSVAPARLVAAPASEPATGPPAPGATDTPVAAEPAEPTEPTEPTASAQSPAAAAPPSNPGEPRKFRPSEQISEDLSVSYPVDI